MSSENYIRTLALFVSGDISISKFQKVVDTRLSELRRSPDMNSEKGILSTIDLYLHEIDEGFRDKGELYAFVQGTLDKMILAHMGSEGVTEHRRCIIVGPRCVTSSESRDNSRQVPNNTTEIKDISLAPAR